MSTFKDINLDKHIQNAIADMGFEIPTEIQRRAIPSILKSKKDLIGLAQTGTGKTAAFSLPIIQNTTDEYSYVQTLVLCPTRELCIQIEKDISQFTKYKKKVKSTSIYGGVSISSQIRALKKGVQLVAGTPGRVLDLLKRGKLDIKDLNYLVLDEADEMLNMGFKEDLEKIFSYTTDSKQVLMFSATMPPSIENIASQFMTKPDLITVGKRNSGAENVKHIYYMASERDRYRALKRIVDISPKIYGIIFCRTKNETKEVANKLTKDGYDVDTIHGDLPQNQRQTVMNKFKNKSIQLLVATDVAARGIDVNNLTHVINYRIPEDLERYIHRSGRTGRAHNKGTSVLIVKPRETRKISSLEKMTKKKFTKKNIPNGPEICKNQLFSLIDTIKDIEVEEKSIKEFMPIIEDKLADLSREELMKKFVSVEFNKFLNYYKNTIDINVASKKDRKKRHNEKSNPNHMRFFLSVGKMDDYRVRKIIELIVERSENPKIDIGTIDILKKISYFEIDKSYEKIITGTFKHDGKRIRIEKAKPRRDSGKSAPRSRRKKSGFRSKRRNRN